MAKPETPINALAYWRDYVIHELMFEDWYMDHKRFMYYEEYDYEVQKAVEKIAS